MFVTRCCQLLRAFVPDSRTADASFATLVSSAGGAWKGSVRARATLDEGAKLRLESGEQDAFVVGSSVLARTAVIVGTDPDLAVRALLSLAPSHPASEPSSEDAAASIVGAIIGRLLHGIEVTAVNDPQVSGVLSMQSTPCICMQITHPKRSFQVCSRGRSLFDSIHLLLGLWLYHLHAAWMAYTEQAQSRGG